MPSSFVFRENFKIRNCTHEIIKITSFSSCSFGYQNGMTQLYLWVLTGFSQHTIFFIIVPSSAWNPILILNFLWKFSFETVDGKFSCEFIWIFNGQVSSIIYETFSFSNSERWRNEFQFVFFLDFCWFRKSTRRLHPTQQNSMENGKNPSVPKTKKSA